ncbi:cation transporter [Noviherbaspirillum agri]
MRNEHASGGLGLTTAFLLAEVVGGVVTDSMALISDIARMFTDTVALAMALALICSDGRSTDSVRTIGYYRFEVLAATFNAMIRLPAPEESTPNPVRRHACCHTNRAERQLRQHVPVQLRQGGQLNCTWRKSHTDGP